MDTFDNTDFSMNDAEWTTLMKQIGFGGEPALEGEEVDESQELPNE